MRFGRGPWMYTIAKMTNQLAGIFFCFFFSNHLWKILNYFNVLDVGRCSGGKETEIKGLVCYVHVLPSMPKYAQNQKVLP